MRQHTHIHLNLYTHVPPCTCTHMQVHRAVDMHTDAHTSCTQSPICADIRTAIPTQRYAPEQPHTHTHTHTAQCQGSPPVGGRTQ